MNINDNKLFHELLNYLYEVSNERLDNYPMENDMEIYDVISQSLSKVIHYDEPKKEPSGKKQ
jgi:hypothetical protein